MRAAAQREPKPKRKGTGTVIYLCPECTGTITAQGITGQCPRTHPERATGPGPA